MKFWRSTTKGTARIRGGLPLTRQKPSLTSSIGIIDADAIAIATATEGIDANSAAGDPETPGSGSGSASGFGSGSGASDSQKTIKLATPSIWALTTPNEIVVPLLDYYRCELPAAVNVGDSVRCGDPLAERLLAPASGQVTAIEPRAFAHPFASQTPSVVIATATSDTETGGARYPALSKPDLARLQDCGIVGLGGAGFQTAEKIQQAGPSRRAATIHTLIINGAECEPLISCDEALMMESPDAIVYGIQQLMALTQCSRCVLAIENDKTAAIEAMQTALADIKITDSIELVLLAPVYPSGAERPLVQAISGVSLADGERPIDHQIACINVATAQAAGQAMNGYPLVSRVVSIAGNRAHTPCNVRVRFGTSIKELLRQSGNLPLQADTVVRIGGPLSGYAINSLDVPITASCNCITLDAPTIQPKEQACIRCGHCAEVCPAGLLPQQLHWHAQSLQTTSLKRFRIDQCIECGCCDVVCPSSIPLTQTFRLARHRLASERRQIKLATVAEDRYKARQIRATNRQLEREKRRQQARQQLNNDSGSIDSALSRIKAQRKRSRGNREQHNQSGNKDQSR